MSGTEVRLVASDDDDDDDEVDDDILDDCGADVADVKPTVLLVTAEDDSSLAIVLCLM